MAGARHEGTVPGAQAPQMALCRIPAHALHLTVVLCPHLILPMISVPLRALELRRLSLALPWLLQPALPWDGPQKGAGGLRETLAHRENSLDPKHGETQLAFF